MRQMGSVIEAMRQGLLMVRSSYVVIAATVLSFFSDGRIEAAPYRPAHCSDIILGYVALGEAVETQGWLTSVKDGIFLKPNQPSAMAPLLVNVSALSGETNVRIKAECAADDFATGGGCHVIARGKVTLVGERHGLSADEIQIQTAH